MAMVGLLAAFRARVTARGMTFTALAHASGVQPGNLRRMFTSTTGSSRLGSVMRLLAPLHARIAPAGARTAAELTAFLDGLRRRSALDWEQVLGVTGPYAGKVAARLESDPEQLSLDVVMRLADALHIELELVDDDAPTIHPRERPMTKRSRASRQGQAPLGEAGPPSASVSVPVLPGEPLVQPSSSAAAPASAVSSPPPAVSSPPPAASAAASAAPLSTRAAATFELAPLRPPRLGRYRDAPSQPTPARPRPAPWTPTKEPTAPGGALVSHLASISGADWSAGFAAMWGALVRGASLPAGLLAGLGQWTEAVFQRFRRAPEVQQPVTHEPPAGWFDALDPIPLVGVWLAAHQPDYHSDDTSLSYDDLGILALHVALDGRTALKLRLAPRGCHRLVQMIYIPRHGPPVDRRCAEVPLEVKIGGEQHRFGHVRAGPVFGEIIMGDRAYLLAAISSLLVVIEARGEGERQRRSIAESLAAASGLKLEVQKREIAELRQAAAQAEALRCARPEPNRLAEVPKPPPCRAEDAESIRERVESGRAPEAPPVGPVADSDRLTEQGAPACFAARPWGRHDRRRSPRGCASPTRRCVRPAGRRTRPYRRPGAGPRPVRTGGRPRRRGRPRVRTRDRLAGTLHRRARRDPVVQRRPLRRRARPGARLPPRPSIPSPDCASRRRWTAPGSPRPRRRRRPLAAIGPFLGLEESFIPYSERYLTLEIREAGTYMASMTTSAKTWVALSDCDAPFATYAGGQLNEPIELLPGRKRITIGTSTADEAVGEIVLRRPLTLGP